jgi:ATP-dependent Clp endopeptidase proteolytic subunit ClpP
MEKLIEINKRNGFSIVNKTETSAEIIIYADIGQTWFEDGVTAEGFSRELKSLPDTIRDITIRINSNGGNVFEGISIYNRIKQHKAKVTVYIDGLAASIASIIALAGDEVVMGEGAMMMIHKPMSGVYGNSIDMEELSQRLDDVEEQLVGIYKRKTNLDRTEIKTMLAEETWMGADQALELGFVDSVMEADEALDIAACVKNVKWFKNCPEIKNTKLIKDRVSNLKTDVEEYLARK